MRLMTTREKVLDCLLTAVIWIISYYIFTLFSYNRESVFSDGMYWFGSLIGYCLAIFTNKIVKKPIIKKSNPNILDDD